MLETYIKHPLLIFLSLELSADIVEESVVSGDGSPVLVGHDFLAHSDLLTSANSEIHVF